MRRSILIIITLASAFLVFRPAEQGYSRETSPATIGADKQITNQGNIVPTGTESSSRQQVNLNETVTYPDTDGDGCNDVEELGPYRMNGGERNPEKRDFFHFGPPNYPPGSFVSKLDLQNEAFRLGAKKGSLLYVPDADVAKVGDYADASIDPITREISVDLHKDLANLGPSDGQIGMDDFSAFVAQLGNQCRGPVTLTLAELSDSCGGNFHEASEAVTVPEPGTVLTDCLLVRDDAGKLIDVVEEELSSEGTTACVEGCSAGSGTAVWYETSYTVKKEEKLADFWRCTPGFGFLPRVCGPEEVYTGLYLTCDWKYLVADNVYNGVVELQYCERTTARLQCWHTDWLGDIQTRWITPGFQEEATVEALFKCGNLPIFGAIGERFYRVKLQFGPWAIHHGSTN